MVGLVEVQRLQDLLANMPEGRVSAIIDSAHVVVARSRAPATYVGASVTPDVLDHLQKEQQGVYPSVTLDGVLVRSGGVIRGGGQMQNEGNTIGKREQIERLGREVDELKGKLAAIEDEIARVTGQHNEINLGMLSDAIRKAQQELGQVEKRRAQIEYEREYAEDLLEEHAAERGKFEEELYRLGSLLEGTEPRRAELRADQEQAERAAREVAGRLEKVEAGFAVRARELNEVQVAMAALRGEERSARMELDRIKRDRENAERTIENHLRRIRKRLGVATTAQAVRVAIRMGDIVA